MRELIRPNPVFLCRSLWKRPPFLQAGNLPLSLFVSRTDTQIQCVVVCSVVCGRGCLLQTGGVRSSCTSLIVTCFVSAVSLFFTGAARVTSMSPSEKAVGHFSDVPSERVNSTTMARRPGALTLCRYWGCPFMRPRKLQRDVQFADKKTSTSNSTVG